MSEDNTPQKFKIGNRVKYRNGDSTFLRGKVFTVSEIKWKDRSHWGYKVQEDSSWLFSEGNLVLVYNGECNGCKHGCKGEKRCGLYEKEDEKEEG